MADSYRVQSSREGEIVQRAMREFGELQAQRALFAGQWEEAAQIVLPTSRNTFFYASFNWQGQKKTDRQVDMTAALALHRFCAIADSLITPRNMFWHGIEADGPDADYIMKDRNTRLWFEKVTRILFQLRYSQEGNFVGQNYNGWQSLGAFGNRTTFVDKFDSRMQPGTRALRYRSVPLGETFYGENHQGVVDRVHRWFRLNACQAAQKFGEEWLPANLQEAYKKDSQYPYDFLHVVRPREEEDYDPSRLDERGKPFESYYICIDGRCLMAPESGYRKFPYAVSRYDQTPGEVYGRGWVQIALPAIKTLNAQKSTFLKQGHRAADPVLLTNDDGSIDGFSLRPGALNKGGLSPDGKKLVDILPTGNIQIAKEMMAEERSLIDDVSLISLLKTMSENPNMKATQVIELVNERAMLIAPTLGRQHSEYIPAMVEREMDLAAEMRLLPPMPPRLREAGAPYRVSDTSPLAKQANMSADVGTIRMLEQSKEIVNITGDMGWIDWVDRDIAMPSMARNQQVPESYLATDEKIAAARKSRAQQQERQQQIDALQPQASMVAAQAKAAKAGVGQPQPGAPQQQQPMMPQ